MDPKIEMKTVLADIRGSIDAIATAQEAKLAKLQQQVDAVDLAGQRRLVNGVATKSVAEEIFEHEDFGVTTPNVQNRTLATAQLDADLHFVCRRPARNSRQQLG